MLTPLTTAALAELGAATGLVIDEESKAETESLLDSGATVLNATSANDNATTSTHRLSTHGLSIVRTAVVLVALIICAASICFLVLLTADSRTYLAARVSDLLSSSNDSSVTSSQSIGQQTVEQFVWQYELCRRADNASEESDLDRLDVNHFLQPIGSAAFPSFILPMSAVMPSIHDELKNNNPKPTYIEIYLLESFWLADSNEWKVAINALYENDAGIAGSHYWNTSTTTRCTAWRTR